MMRQMISVATSSMLFLLKQFSPSICVGGREIKSLCWEIAIPCGFLCFTRYRRIILDGGAEGGLTFIVLTSSRIIKNLF